MTLSLKNFLLIIGALMLLGFRSFGAEEPYENFIRGSIKKNDSLFVKDEKFKNPLFNWSEITNISVKNTIALSILSDKPMTKDFHLNVWLRIAYFSSPEQVEPTILDSVKLSINYEKGLGKVYQMTDNYRFVNGFSVKISILDVQSPELGADVPEIFQLTNTIVVNRKYQFNALMPIAVSGSMLTSTAENSNGAMLRSSGGEKINNSLLRLTWDPLPSGEEYDVEWVAVDTTSDNVSVLKALVLGGTTVPEYSIEPFFKNNSTRITTTIPNYTISLVYDAYAIIVRVRQVSYLPDGTRDEGVWSYSQDIPPKYTAWELNWHEEKMNWQYSANFAEEGKKKEVVTYFDGSLRGRQTVTLNNQDDVAVVQENIYDRYGRVAANILPAPFRDSGIYPQNLHYFQKFNRDSTGNSSYRFSNLNFSNCEVLPEKLSPLWGASKYYSVNNDFKNDVSLPSFKNYIPDAGQYPLSVTQYTADNTGRIKLQGGVGLAFQPGAANSHTTKYYYGKPEQWELDRIFGNDVGYASHYLKNVVIDPNNQISISYLNASGKTIATALSGDVPGNVAALNSSSTVSRDTVPIITPKEFVFSSSALTLTAHATHLVSAVGSGRMEFDIEQLINSYNVGAFQFKSNNYYNLKITIISDCNKTVLDTIQNSIGSSTYDATKNMPFKQSFNVNFADVGEYYITIEFTLNKKVISDYTDRFIAEGQSYGAIKSESDFIWERLKLSLGNFEDCLADCRTAVEKLGSKSEFTMMFKVRLKELGADSGAYNNKIDSIYNFLSTKAQALRQACNGSLNVCDQYRSLMLADVSPGGQYALFNAESVAQEQEINVIYNKFRLAFPILSKTDLVYKANQVTKSDGTISSPNDTTFTIQDLIKYWKPEWAEKFLEFHPEICKLLFCEANATSGAWDERLKDIGEMSNIPVKMPGLTYNPTVNSWLLDNDPFFAGRPTDKASMLADLNNYSKNVLKIDPVLTGANLKSLKDYVDYQLYSADSLFTTSDGPNTSGLVRWNQRVPKIDCRVEDREWQLYRDLYLELKQKYFELARQAACPGCTIGKPLTLPDLPSAGSDCNYGLGLGQYAAQVSSHKFIRFDYNYNIKYTYTLVQGVPDVEPFNPDSCRYVNPFFYPCLTVDMPDGTKRNFVNVWLFTCQERLDDSNCEGEEYEVYADVYVGMNTFHIPYCDPHTAYIFTGYSSSTPPASIQCANYRTSKEFYKCYTVYAEGGTVHFYNNVWVQNCYDTSSPGSGCEYLMFAEENTAAKNSLKKGGDDEITITDLGSKRKFIIRRQKSSKKGKLSTRKNFKPYELKEYFVIQNAPNNFIKLKNVWVSQEIKEDEPSIPVGMRGGQPPQFSFEKSQSAMLNCSPLLLQKMPRFITIDFSDTISDKPAQIYDNLQMQLRDSIKSTCENGAIIWMNRFSEGLQEISATAAERTLLQTKMAELCTYGGDLTHPFGASSLPNNQYIIVNGNNCYNFGDIIKAVFGSTRLPYFKDKLNPWLLDSPYPYNKVPQTVEKIISNTNPSICSRLSSLRPGGMTNNLTYYNYLKTTYGSAMQLSYQDFTALLEACGNCRFLLKKNIILPPVFDDNYASCITRTDFNTAVANLNSQFNNQLDTNSTNYEEIYSNFMNHRFGVILSYEKYYTFRKSTNIAVLCNELPYTGAPEDNYACQKAVIEVAVLEARNLYNVYINDLKSKYDSVYVTFCASAKANVRLDVPHKIYHYTLYYYDQAGNLVRTIPPEGVNVFNNKDVLIVDRARNLNLDGCSNVEAKSKVNENAAMQSLSNTLTYNGNAAIEVWLYQSNFLARQMITTTADKKYIFQTCIKDGYLNIDIYRLQQETGQDIRITGSNHASVSMLDINPGLPWTHIVVQGPNIATGTLQVWVNGELHGTTRPSPTASCAWEINSIPALATPKNLSNLKYMRLYTGRLMSAGEIKANAESSCFDAQVFTEEWYRFNVPNAGDPTTIAAGSTQETQYNPLYPVHTLATTYAYNSGNQVIKQFTPDAETSRFWYDNLSRLVVSQNAKQYFATGINKFSYTKYDVLGRIIEVGEKAVNNVLLQSEPQRSVPGYLTKTVYDSFLASGANSQLTQTFYDDKPPGDAGVRTDLLQNNLRKRVSSSIYRENTSSSNINASYYSYDISGNVKTLYQQIAGLGVKRIGYEYDLASGKVNFVSYQYGSQNDRFYYQYKYDAENRLTEAWSAVDADTVTYGVGSTLDFASKKLDAKYQYYLHGPLARMELGNDKKVQGLDYAYTLQGWLKGVNGNVLIPGEEQGNDGANGANHNVSKDAFAYTLGYYPGDYTPIGGSSQIAYKKQWQPGGDAGSPLYNGNISNSIVSIRGIGTNNNPVGYTYAYDQLNRLVKMRQKDLDNTGTTWNSAGINNKYKESYSYDANGNILRLSRYNASGQIMDSLTYSYNNDPNTGKLKNNMLASLADVSNSNIAGELRGISNYEYDKIGNLRTDLNQNLRNVQWSVYGKIRQLTTGPGVDTAVVKYTYDPSGNRVSKTIGALTTWYVRDAQGNPLAVYDNAGSAINWREQQLYGSSRLGMWKPGINIATTEGATVWTSANKKNYELTNHLGNVLAVITDKDSVGTDGIGTPSVLSAQDYYPFGMIQPGRNFSSSAYRYGFNGKENDDDVGKGTGNQQDYGMRIYDPRIGKFLSVDPITNQYPELTPYQFASNRPLDGIDRDGLEHERAVGGDDGMALANLFMPKDRRLSLSELNLIEKAKRRGAAYGSAIGLTTALGVYYTPHLYCYFITNPNAAPFAGGIIWGALVDEDAPGFGDDLARDARGALSAAERAINKAAGAEGSFVVRRFKEIDAMSKKAWFQYQGQINGLSGKAAGAWEYLKNGVRFDGFKNGVLLEAKGFYQQLFKRGKTDRLTVFGRMMDQLARQVGAAKGNKLEWHFAEQSTLDEFKLFLNQDVTGRELLKGVELKYTEYKPEKL